ncbi:MAG: tetraacyldisaccharide 4'-kinase [Candidatus Aminicenantes bacterium]|nr:MAG: tetraacyldisaccharide 4'-kinase [Candidatus Aminicenantes bacterium]
MLRPLIFLYQMGSRINNFLFDQKLRKIERASLPVISIGNLAFGGSEKTPLVMHLLSFFTEHQLNPALITRGYKGKWEKSGGILSDGKNICGTWQEAGDEPFMVLRNFPHVGIFVGRNRLISCEKAKQEGFTLLILDDGFQHRQLHRDLDIVLFDPDERIALRESISSLRRADIILVKKNNRFHVQSLRKHIPPKAKVFFYSTINKGFFAHPDGIPIPTEQLKRKRFLVVCGIARPERFFSLLEKEELEPLLSLAFSDHHAYPISTRKKIMAAFQRVNADAVLTTEKDVFKLDELYNAGQIPVYYNKLGLHVEKDFYQELLSLKKDG